MLIEQKDKRFINLYSKFFTHCLLICFHCSLGTLYLKKALLTKFVIQMYICSPEVSLIPFASWIGCDFRLVIDLYISIRKFMNIQWVCTQAKRWRQAVSHQKPRVVAARALQGLHCNAWCGCAPRAAASVPPAPRSGCRPQTRPRDARVKNAFR